MSIASMKKLSVIGHTSVQKDLMKRLMSLGVVEITTQEGTLTKDEWKGLVTTGDSRGAGSRYDSWIGRTSQALEALEKYGSGKKPLFQTRTPISTKAFQLELADRHRIEKEVEILTSHLKRLAEIQTAENKLESNRMMLSPWKEFDLPLEIHGTKSLDVILGIIPSSASPDLLKQEIQAATELASFELVMGDAEQFYVAVLVAKKERDTVDDVLKNFGFNRIHFNEIKGTARENIEAIDAKSEELQKRRDEVTAAIGEKESLKKDFEILHDYLILKRDQVLIRDRLLVTDKTFYLDGWFPRGDQEAVSQLLQEMECYFTVEDPKKDEEIPVLLLNGAFNRPFESVTKLYSLPDSRGIDATPFFGIFYAIFFGMMLSDAAYGVILAAVTFVILRKFKLEGMAGQLMKMFFYCGLSTVFFGVLFGGYFGDLVTVVADTFFGAELVIPALWFAPMDDPMKLLIACFILGGVQIFLGMALDGYLSIRDGRPLDALFDIGLWYILLVGLVLLLTGAGDPIGKWMSIVGVVGILITGGRHNSGIGKITGGLSSLYGITGYLSDVLSYSRILALGLATGVIASVVNTMGSLAGGGLTGLALMIVAFVVGHSYNMAINSLGAFVHSCRLQYVEFFGKFYKSGGEAFEPFREKTKYVEIIREDH